MRSFRGLLASIIATILAIILIRLLLIFIGANGATPFVQFWMDLSYLFVGLFIGMFPNMVLGNIVLESASIIACIFYLILGFGIGAIEGSFRDRRGSILTDVIGFVFRVVEFILICRFVFVLIGANASSWFVELIYDLSAIVYEPFVGIISNSVVAGLTIEWSTLVILIIIIIIDEAVDGLLKSANVVAAPQPPQNTRPA